jgi:hypothetical protein
MTTSAEERLAARLAVIEHSLEGGNKAFESIRKDIAAVSPKPIEWSKLLTAVFGVSIAVGGIIYAVADKFADRPRWDQLQNTIRPMDDAQRSTRKSVDEIKDSQFKLEISVKAMEAAQTAQGRKIDQLLQSERKGKR